MTKPRIRCAIYTRKSSEEGLEQDFNSLDAQREACEAYVKSQQHEGWTAFAMRFDDGGFSGGTMNRPALQLLLEAIEAGKVDVVVVYKVDRLTRALADFAKIVEQFDEKGVSFVSVTQQFNTTSSMGRLTLNVLLSFAQFEREVTGERIRDKIAASKKKGMWMGGSVPLGYEAKDRTLIINEAEAQTVRELFGFYLEHKSVRAVRDQAEHQGLRSKSGAVMEPGALYTLLQNPVYIGKIKHKDKVYEGLHDAIIVEETWEAAQSQLEQNRVDRKNGTNAKSPSLLAGKLFDDQEQPFTPSHAVKQGKRYRYYIERSVIKGAKGANGTKRPRKKRIAATEIEGLVRDAVALMLKTPTDVSDAVLSKNVNPGETRRLYERASALAETITDDADKGRVLLRDLISKVVIAEAGVAIELDRAVLAQTMEIDDVDSSTSPHVITVPARLRPRGVELRFVIDGPGVDRRPNPDPALIKAVVRAHRWWNILQNGKVQTLSELASHEGITPRYVRRILGLAFLAPDIVTMIVDGTQPVDMTAETVTRLTALPPLWPDQRTFLHAH